MPASTVVFAFAYFPGHAFQVFTRMPADGGAVMVICGIIFSVASWSKLPETHPPAARIAFNARNLVATSWTVLSHREFLLLALAAASNFCSLACFIGSAPAIIEEHWGMSETSYAALFLPVITGILAGATISRRIAGHMDLTRQVHLGLAISFIASLTRVILHLSFDSLPIPLQQALLFCAASGAQFAFPVLTLRMLDLFPAARGTAASAQSFVALLVTAFTLGIVSPKVLPHLEWIAWTSLSLTGTAAVCWFFSLRALAAKQPVDVL